MSNQVNHTIFGPHLAALYELLAASSPVYKQVLEFNSVKPGEIIGNLARSWEASPDGSTWTFRLHEGVKWHDGLDVTADDAGFNIERMYNLGSSARGLQRQRCDRELAWYGIAASR